MTQLTDNQYFKYVVLGSISNVLDVFIKWPKLNKNKNWFRKQKFEQTEIENEKLNCFIDLNLRLVLMIVKFVIGD